MERDLLYVALSLWTNKELTLENGMFSIRN